MQLAFLASVLPAILAIVPQGKPVDLGAKYRATLDYAEGVGGRDWQTEPSDVWSLNSFSYKFKGELELRCESASVVFGKNGTNVLWAALLPDKPGKIVSAPSGRDENFTSIFLRFHPALVGELFPAKTVNGNGEAEKLLEARRIYQHKAGSSWQHDNLPVIPWKHALVFDCETSEKNRRFYMVDAKDGAVKYEPAFLGRRLSDSESPKLAGKQGAEVFDAVWKAFDEEYAMFGVKPKVDWQKLRERYRPLAEKASTVREAAGVVALLLEPLEDLHIWVKCGEEWVWTFNRFRPMNASWKATKKLVAKLETPIKDLAFGEMDGGIGYAVVWSLGDPSLPDAFDKALESLKKTKGLILDLRFNGGGDENLAKSIAGRFVDKTRTYSTNQYRNGPKHHQLGERFERKFESRGAWRYAKPVAVLIGQKTMSSAESFAAMMAQCPQASTIGDRTAGSSANPRQIELAGGIVVNLPRWLDMTVDGKPIDGVGFAPEIPVKAGPKDFSDDRDPVVEAALAWIKKGGARKAQKP